MASYYGPFNFQAPRCKFTRALMELFASKDVEFSYFDIFSDEDVREALKLFGEWPTYPQVFLHLLIEKFEFILE